MYTNITTERLNIRPINLQDAEFILRLVNTEGWLEFIGDRNITTIHDAQKYIQAILDNTNFYYSVFELKSPQQAVGIITFLKRDDEKYPDIGFALLPEFQQLGYAFEASCAYLATVKASAIYDDIIAMTISDNINSISLLKKLGFSYTGTQQKEHGSLSYFSLRAPNPHSQ